MGIELDVRGLACPAPVLKTKEVVEKEGPKEITVIVDSDSAKQNVSRFLSSQGFSVIVKEEKGGIKVIGILQDGACSGRAPVEEQKEESEEKILILITSDKMGHGDDELGRKLMHNFVRTLKEMGGLWRIIFLNSGVKLTASGSPLLVSLKELQDMGVQIFACGTCLDYFGLLNRKAIGETTNMLDIVTSLQLADKVIHI